MSARRLVLLLFAVVGVMVFACAPALAVVPETPETGSANAVTANTATLEGGVLNPNAAGEPGEYEYLYKASASECEGGSVAPVPEGIAAGIEKEVVPPVKLTGLRAAQAYTFCLVERKAANPEEVGPASPPVTFTTLNSQPAIESEYASYVEASGATLNAQIDPDGEATTYHFQYGTSESYGETTAETTLPENGTAKIRIPAGGAPSLKPETTYHYRVVAINSLSPAGGTPGSDRTFTTPAAVDSEVAQNCSNEQRRAEQPYALELPDCRAYEMVSPLETNGQDATDSFTQQARAAVSGEAIAYSSRGTFANPTGETGENQFISRRGREGWSTQSVTPFHDPEQTQPEASFAVNALTPELTEGVANTDAALTTDVPSGSHTDLYVDDFSNSSYQYIGSENKYPLGASTDLSRVVFGEFGSVSEWVDGKVVPVGVNNEGSNISASVGAIAPNGSYISDRDLWHAVSANGSRVYFTSPQAEGPGKEFIGQLYVRVNADQPQSPLASSEVNGTGTLTAGSDTVTSLVVAAGSVVLEAHSGSTELEINTTTGRFAVGQPLSGTGIAPGTTIAGISGDTFTLSIPTIEYIGRGSYVSSGGPAPLVVGQEIAGNGIPRGTTIVAVAPGSLTLSAPAASSVSAVELDAGGGCTVAADACTIEISASQRLSVNPAGAQTALYRGASADGSKVFFLSGAELTEDAYTGPAGNAMNLYEYDLDRPEGERLRDLTVDRADANGAGVLGVVQISEEGSYVYFVAEGVLAAGATARQPNLYLSHDGGAPILIATLSANDRGDWYVTSSFGYPSEGGPEVNTAVVTPSGSRLAFLSEESLTGYDNEQTESGECEGTVGGANKRETGRCQEVYLYDAETGGLVCASCDPTGARPVGPSSFTTKKAQIEGLYRPRNLLEGGTLFFDSSDALVPHASDGRLNVYEYEDGHVQPISDVAGGYESFFLDASADGADVFFGSADQLLPQEASNNVVVYDARVGGGFPVTVASPSCDNGDSCKPPPAPQPDVFGAPGSATFSGPGNIAPVPAAKPVVKEKAKGAKCKKGYEKKKGKCVKKKRKPKKKAGKSSDRKGSK